MISAYRNITGRRIWIWFHSTLTLFMDIELGAPKGSGFGSTHISLNVCLIKSGTLDFRYLGIRIIAFFILSDKPLFSEKNDTKIIEIGWVVLILLSFLKTYIVIFKFLLILVTFQSGIMAFLTSIHCCTEALDPCKQNKERINYTYGQL